MTSELVSLAFITLLAFLCPIIAQLIPHKPVAETVFLLAAGAICGPFGLDLVQTSDSISLLSDLGLGFLFLLAGYEIDPKALVGSQGKRGLATWFVTLAIAFLVVALWPEFSITTIDGLAVVIALTTTAIGTLMPILEERGVVNTSVGQSVLAYGTWGELMPILAMTLLLSTRAEWATVLALVAFVAIALLAGIFPKRARSAGSFVFRFIRDNAETNAQMAVRTVVMLLVALIAVSAVFSLDIVLGAFAGGFILRFVIPEGNVAMEGKLRAIGFGFFIPLFFIVSGANIDVTAIATNPGLLALFICLLLFVRSLPILVALTLDRKTRAMSFNNRLSVAIYCATALPLIVAVTTVAVSANAMSPATASVLVAAGGVTVLVMPLLATVIMRTADADLPEAAREIRKDPKKAGSILREHRNLEVQRHKEQVQQERERSTRPKK